MKVSPIMQTNTYKSKPASTKSCFSRMVSGAKTRTQNFIDEVRFIWRDIKRTHTYVYYGGKKVSLDQVPNYAGMPDGVLDKGVKFARLRFLPEDEEKMKNLSPREYIEYGKKLIEQGRYTKDAYYVNKN